MELRTIKLENGMTAVVGDRPAPTPAQSAFAAELARVAEAAKQAEAAGSTKLQAVYSSLTPISKAVLDRLKAGMANVTKEEWNNLRRELKETGLISGEEYFYTDPDIVVLGDVGDFMDEKGAFIGGCCTVTYEKAGRWNGFGGIEWGGDPFEYLDQWLEMLRKERDAWDAAVLADGITHDTSARTRQIEAHEKVSGLVKELMELC